jgi:hypothetical protein
MVRFIHFFLNDEHIGSIAKDKNAYVRDLVIRC